MRNQGMSGVHATRDVHPSVVFIPVVAMLVVLMAVAGCATVQLYSSPRHDNVSLQGGDLETYGLAFISPSTITGREEDKQALALVFSQVLREMRPGIPVVSLSETLGRVNAEGLAEGYMAMYDDYQVTGLFKREALARLGEVTDSRFLAQLKLASFEQGSATRFGTLGLKIVNTKVARIRIFLQIWDSRDGSIAWEGIEELTHSDETVEERLITFRNVVEESAASLIERLPPEPGVEPESAVPKDESGGSDTDGQ
jgi:hypothetical protein